MPRSALAVRALVWLISTSRLGWASAWRSLLVGALIFYSLSLGNLLQTKRDPNDVVMVMSVMGMTVFVGVTVDQVLFSPIERRVRARWGFGASR